jgi:hypothetical protein
MVFRVAIAGVAAPLLFPLGAELLFFLAAWLLTAATVAAMATKEKSNCHKLCL